MEHCEVTVGDTQTACLRPGWAVVMMACEHEHIDHARVCFLHVMQMMLAKHERLMVCMRCGHECVTELRLEDANDQTR